ncbi:MAG: dCTP deaminase, partial [Candidatus Aenigmatarchaeota archaeon]
NNFRIFKSISSPFIDTKQPIEGYTEVLELDNNKPFILHPGEFVLGITQEYIKMPDDLVGMIDGRTSLGRLGIGIHTTSAGINPGWEGKITLEISNNGKMPVALYPGMRVCKLSFIKMSSPPEKHYGLKEGAKYQAEEEIKESKIFKEFK